MRTVFDRSDILGAWLARQPKGRTLKEDITFSKGVLCIHGVEIAAIRFNGKGERMIFLDAKAAHSIPNVKVSYYGDRVCLGTALMLHLSNSGIPTLSLILEKPSQWTLKDIEREVESLPEETSEYWRGAFQMALTEGFAA